VATHQRVRRELAQQLQAHHHELQVAERGGGQLPLLALVPAQQVQHRGISMPHHSFITS
jgi:hypothetical protein